MLELFLLRVSVLLHELVVQLHEALMYRRLAVVDAAPKVCHTRLAHVDCICIAELKSLGPLLTPVAWNEIVIAPSWLLCSIISRSCLLLRTFAFFLLFLLLEYLHLRSLLEKF